MLGKCGCWITFDFAYCGLLGCCVSDHGFAFIVVSCLGFGFGGLLGV